MLLFCQMCFENSSFTFLLFLWCDTQHCLSQFCLMWCVLLMDVCKAGVLSTLIIFAVLLPVRLFGPERYHGVSDIMGQLLLKLKQKISIISQGISHQGGRGGLGKGINDDLGDEVGAGVVRQKRFEQPNPYSDAKLYIHHLLVII